MQVLVDQVGYEARAPKQALVMGTPQDHPQAFSLLDAATGKTVFTGTLTAAGQVHAWNGAYWIADFSSWQKPGHYRLQTKTAAGEVSSCPFEIADDVLERNTLSNVLYYFKGQRSSGLIDQADRHLPLPGGEQGFRRCAWRLVRRHRRLWHPLFSSELDVVLQSAADAAGGMELAQELWRAAGAATTTTSPSTNGACWMKVSTALTSWCA